MKRLQEFLSKYLVIVVAIVVGFIGVLSFFFTAYFQADYRNASEATFYRLDNIIFNILGIVVAVGIIFLYHKLVKKVNIWVILSIVLGLALLTQIIYIQQIKFIPTSDQSIICFYANEMLKGNLKDIFVPGSYLNNYPFQTWLTGFIAVIFKYFGKDNFLVFQVMNVIASVCNMALLFLITRKLFQKETVQKICLLLILGFNLYFVFFNVHVYGNIMGLTFSLIAIYTTMLFMEKKHWWYLIISGIAITIAIFFKSNYNIFLCGILLTLVLYAMQQKKWKICFSVLLVGIIYLGVTKTATKLFEKKIGAEMPGGVPMLSYVYMGLADNPMLNSGWYTADTIEIYHKNKENTKAATEETKVLLKERVKYWLQNPGYAIYFMADKEASTWLNPTFQAIWCSLPSNLILDKYPEYASYFESKKGIISMLNGKAYQVEEGYFNIYQIIIFVLASVGMISVTKKAIGPEMTIIPMLFFGGFLFHLFWETKAIYVLQYYFLLLPFAAYGIYQGMQWMQNYMFRNKLLQETQE